MAYPAVRPLPKLPLPTSTARHGPYLLVRVCVRPERRRAQSCAIALRSPAPERSSDLKRYSPDILLLRACSKKIPPTRAPGKNVLCRGYPVCGAGLHALAHALGSLDPCGVTCDDGGKYAVCLHSSSPMQLRPVQTHVPVPCAVASGKMQFENVAREWRCKWKDDGGGNAACETPVPRGGKWARTQRPAAPRTAQGCCAPRPA